MEKIKFKRTNTAGKVPTAVQCDKGELLLNSKDGRIFTQNESGAIVPLGESLLGGSSKSAVIAEARAGLSVTHQHPYLSNRGGTLDGGANTTLTIKCDDAGEAVLNLMGDAQGTGRLYVGQSASHGGGIEYNGDGTPVSSGAGSDYITLYRTSSGVKSWTAKNLHADNHWIFRGQLYAMENKRVFHEGLCPNKTQVGLGNVNNWGATSSVSDVSNSKYATAGAVKVAYDLASSKITQAQGDTWWLGKTAKATDSEKLDGLDSSDFSRSTHTHTAAQVGAVPTTGGTFTGKVTFGGGVHMNLGEGLEFLSDNDYFGVSADARIIRMHDNNSSNSQVDGGLIFDARSGVDGKVLELLRIRVGEFKWKGHNIFHEGHAPNSTEVGLGNVNNWGATSSVSDASTSKYATAKGVKTAYDRAVSGETNAKIYADNLISQLLGDNPAAHLDTIKELGDALNANGSAIGAINAELAKKATITQLNTKVSKAGDTMTGRLTLNYGDPTVVLQDTNGKSSLLHTNSNQFYVLRSAGNNGTTWDSGPNGRHPLTLSLDTGHAYFSGDVYGANSKCFTLANIASNASTVLSAIASKTKQRISATKTLAAGKWYQIAKGNARCSAEFIISDPTSGKHSNIRFTASIMYGNGACINIISRSAYGGTCGIFKNIRIRRLDGDNTYGNYAVEVECEAAGVMYAEMSNEVTNTDGWVFQTALPEAVAISAAAPLKINSPASYAMGSTSRLMSNGGLVYDTVNKPTADDVGALTQATADGRYIPKNSDVGANDIFWSGDRDYRGLYWGSRFNDAAAHSGAWAYIRQGVTQGQLEIGSDELIDIYETDSRVLAVQISTNSRTLDAKGGLKENGVALSAKYLGLTAKAADSDKLDGLDSASFSRSTHDHVNTYLGIRSKAVDSDKLDGLNSTDFSRSTHNHNASYLGIRSKAADSEKLDGLDSSDFSRSNHTHNVDDLGMPLTTISKTLDLTTNWIDTGITASHLSSGSYMLQISGMASSTGFYSEILTGTISWYSSNTNSADADEIMLHKAGHASSGRMIYLRTLRQGGSTAGIKLQMKCSTDIGSSSYTFKFRKLI